MVKARWKLIPIDTHVIELVNQITALITLNGTTVGSWSSKQKLYICRNSTESELVF
jgi:hypothetical protein